MKIFCSQIGILVANRGRRLQLRFKGDPVGRIKTSKKSPWKIAARGEWYILGVTLLPSEVLLCGSVENFRISVADAKTGEGSFHYG